MKIFTTSGFNRQFEKYAKKLSQKQFDEVSLRLQLFEDDWKDPRLKTHKLKDAKGKWAFAVLDDNTRSDGVVFVFRVEEEEVTKQKVIWLLGIGSHDIVYAQRNL